MLKLLKVDRVKKTLLEIEEINIKPELFVKEKEMEDFFAENDNLNRIFPSWHLLTQQWRIGNDKIQDTIIFNPTTLSFAIVEYKLDDYNRIQQVLKYLEEMSQEEKENLIEEAKFNYYYKNGKRGEKDIYKYKLWKGVKPKLILISSLSEKLKSLSQLPNTSVVKIGLLKIEGESFLYVNTDDSDLLFPKKIIKPLQPCKMSIEKVSKEESKNISDYQKTWKKETSEWMEKEIKILWEKFPGIYSVNRPKSTVVDVKIGNKTILTLSWKDGRLNQPKIFLVNPSDLLRKKYDDIKNSLVDKEDNTFEYFLEKEQLFRSGRSLLTEFIEERIKNKPDDIR